MITQQKIKRRPLANGNVYYTDEAKLRRFRISDPWLRGPNPGIAVQWLTVGGEIDRGQFFFRKTADEFWRQPLFQNAIDAEVE
jgi:hypothetical protein